MSVFIYLGLAPGLLLLSSVREEEREGRDCQYTTKMEGGDVKEDGVDAGKQDAADLEGFTFQDVYEN